MKVKIIKIKKAKSTQSKKVKEEGLSKREKQALIYLGLGIGLGVTFALAPVLLPAYKAHLVRAGIINGGKLLLA